MNNLMDENSKLKTIKILDIGFTISIYFVYVILCIKIMNIVLDDYKDIKKYSNFKLLISFLIRLWLIGIFAYLGRNYLIYIKFPLDGYYNYDHK